MPLKAPAFGTDLRADTTKALLRLLARRTPLSPQDRDDVKLLLGHTPTGLDRLPADIPIRETKALVLGNLPLDRRTRAAVRPLLAAHLTTATDVLRLLQVRSGDEAGIALEHLLDAFVGFMALSSKDGRDASYDPRTVRRRYDLEGDSRIHPCFRAGCPVLRGRGECPPPAGQGKPNRGRGGSASRARRR
ncbi:hypothetical protein ACWC3X_19995 [Streptomyces populi]|jgi:hypothetical protein